LFQLLFVTSIYISIIALYFIIIMDLFIAFFNTCFHHFFLILIYFTQRYYLMYELLF